MTERPDELADEMRRVLEEHYAPTGTLVSYSDLSSQLTTRLVHPEFMDRPLGRVSTETARETGGRIMLSALVVNGETMEPGTGFFRLARDLGLLSVRNHDGELAFWLDQVQQITRHYGSSATV
jgi:hypothetical protein